MWGAVDRLDDRWARHAVVQGEVADVRSVIGARLAEAVGVSGLDASFPTGETDLQAQIDDLLTWAEVSDDDGLTDLVITREADLVEAGHEAGCNEQEEAGLLLLLAFVTSSGWSCTRRLCRRRW